MRLFFYLYCVLIRSLCVFRSAEAVSYAIPLTPLAGGELVPERPSSPSARPLVGDPPCPSFPGGGASPPGSPVKPSFKAKSHGSSSSGNCPTLPRPHVSSKNSCNFILTSREFVKGLKPGSPSSSGGRAPAPGAPSVALPFYFLALRTRQGQQFRGCGDRAPYV